MLPASVRCIARISVAVWLGLAASAALAADPELDAALGRAVLERDLEAALGLIRRGAEVEASTENGKTALMLAAAEGDRVAVATILDAGADVNATNDNGGTALMYAAAQSRAEVVEALLERGAAVDHVSGNGWTALTIAAAKDQAEVARLLLAAGADPNRTDVYGWTPLMRAIGAGQLRSAQVLVAHPRAVVTQANDEGWSALHLAAARGYVELVRGLLERGAAPQATDHRGRTALVIARLANQAEVAALLDRRGREPAAP